MKRYVNALACTMALLLLVSTVAMAEVEFFQVAEFDVPEANQGIGVDRNYFYAVDNQQIAKYDKETGHLVDKWQGDEDGPILHLDSAVVKNGKIYCSHSNYRYLPMTSSIEIWDAATMEHIGTHSLGILLGSLTWLDYHRGHWYGTFANYDKEAKDPYGNKAGVVYGGQYNTTLVQFGPNWQILQSWIFPVELLEKFGVMSNSGGSWGPDGNLYITGHDLSEIYQIKFPEAGSILEVVETSSLNVRGQGIAWDRSEPGMLYGIIRATNEEEAAGISNKAVVFESTVEIDYSRRKKYRHKFESSVQFDYSRCKKFKHN